MTKSLRFCILFTLCPSAPLSSLSLCDSVIYYQWLNGDVLLLFSAVHGGAVGKLQLHLSTCGLLRRPQ